MTKSMRCHFKTNFESGLTSVGLSVLQAELMKEYLSCFIKPNVQWIEFPRQLVFYESWHWRCPISCSSCSSSQTLLSGVAQSATPCLPHRLRIIWMFAPVPFFFFFFLNLYVFSSDYVSGSLGKWRKAKFPCNDLTESLVRSNKKKQNVCYLKAFDFLFFFSYVNMYKAFYRGNRV